MDSLYHGNMPSFLFIVAGATLDLIVLNPFVINTIVSISS